MQATLPSTPLSPPVLPLALALAGEALQLDLGLAEPQASPGRAPAGIGPVEHRGNWQVRSFFGYHQSREGAAGAWRFYVSSFGRTRPGGDGTCHVLLWDGRLEEVRIDGRHRLAILGKLYGPAHWDH